MITVVSNLVVIGIEGGIGRIGLTLTSGLVKTPLLAFELFFANDFSISFQEVFEAPEADEADEC